MSLKVFMLRGNIDAKKAELEALCAKDTDFAARENELKAHIEEAKNGDAEARAFVEAEVSKFDAEQTEHNSAKAQLEADISAMEAELAELEAKQEPPAPKTSGVKITSEGVNFAMNQNVNIRKLPRSQRAFEAVYTYEERKQIVQQEGFAKFVNDLRALSGRGAFASVSGAELMIPEVLLPLIAENMFRYSKLLNRVRVETVRGDAKQTIAGLVPPAVWTECCGALNEIDFSFGQWPMSCNKLGAVLPVCNSTLEDSTLDGLLNLASALVEVLSMALGLGKDQAILYGTGNGMPLGIVTRLAQTSQPANYPANAPAWVDLHTSNIITINGDSLTGAAFWAALEVAAGNTFTRYSRGDLFWTMNSKTYSYLKSKAIATTVTGEWVALIGGRLPIVSGDIDVLEFIPDGDVIGGYGDLYLWAQREGTVIGMDNVGYVNRVADQTLFFARERADGAPIIPGAFVAINLRNSSPTTTYAFPTDKANDATLASLVIGETLSPTFNKATLTYTATASNASDVVTVIPSQSTAEVALTLKKGTSTAETILNGSTVTWATGTNVLTVTVKQGASTLTYTVTVTKN